MTKRAQADDPVFQAKSAVERLNDQELEFAFLYQAKIAELASVRGQRGAGILGASDPGAAAAASSRQVLELQEAAEALADAAAAARQQRLAAIPLVYQAASKVSLMEVGDLEAEAKVRAAESARLLGALEQHDNCRYEPLGPTSPERAIGGQQGGALAVVHVHTPRHERLLADASALRQGAAQMVHRQPHSAGSIEGDSLDELLRAAYADAMRIAPAAPEVVSWAQRALEKEGKRRARLESTEDGFTAPDAPVRFHLQWQNGVIDQGASGITTPAPAVERGVQDFDSSDEALGIGVGDLATAAEVAG